jgi:hypothetical protein
MRIGSDDGFLSVEKVGRESSTITWCIAAGISGSGWCFTALHDCVQVDNADEVASLTADFTARKVQRIDMILREGGWMRIRRTASGCILVRYRVGQVSCGAALEGEIGLRGESAEAFCRHLGDLL